MSIFVIYRHILNSKIEIMNISLTKKQEAYIANQLESGDFQNASELVRDALRLHEVYRHRVINDLKAEIEKGWSGATSKRLVTDIINDKRKKQAS
jgi:antitoxin ParD1/3/4